MPLRSPSIIYALAFLCLVGCGGVFSSRKLTDSGTGTMKNVTFLLRDGAMDPSVETPPDPTEVTYTCQTDDTIQEYIELLTLFGWSVNGLATTPNTSCH